MVHLDHRDSVAMMRLEHGKVNALDLELLQELRRHLDELREASDVRAVVLTGSGRSFSAGVDLFRILEGGPSYIEEFMKAFRNVLLRIAEFPKPVVAAVNGHAIAGGCVLACACDYRVMTQGEGEGKMGIPELLVGVPFPALAWELLGSAVPEPEVRRLALTGKLLSPEEALRTGLVDELVKPELLGERARARAEQLGRIPPETYRLTKRRLRRSLREHEGDALDKEVLAAWSSPETHEAIRAYLEKTLGKRS